MIGEPIHVIWIIVIPFVSLYSQHLLRENVTIVPRTPKEYYEQTRDLMCNDPMHNVTYVLNPDSVGTSIGCFQPIPALKYCLEYNFKNGKYIIQSKYNAPCLDLSITPCKAKYFSSESYKLFECFEKYGGISSPIQNERNINFLNTKIQELKKTLEQREVSLTKEIQELKKEFEQKGNSFTKKIQELKKKTIDQLKENDDLKKYKWIATVFIIAFILSVLFILFIFFHFRKIIIKKKSLETRIMSLTSTDNSAPTTERKSDDQQKEGNRDEDHSKREKREKAAIKSIQYRLDFVQPEDSDVNVEKQGLCEEYHKNIQLKPKLKTSAVFFATETLGVDNPV